MIPVNIVDQFIGLLASEQSTLSTVLSTSSDDDLKKKTICEVKEINQILSRS
jgi:hypothetical protein